MTELKPWVDSGAPDGVRELLLAAREERPDGGGTERTLVALGVGGAVITGAAHASGAAGVGAAAGAAKSVVAASSAALAVKWGLIGAVSAVVTMGAVHVALTSRAAERVTAQAAASHVNAPNTARAATATRSVPEPAPEVVVTTAAPAVTDVAEAPPARTPLEVAPTKSPLNPPEAASAASARDDSPRMLEEIRAIDRARSALASGDAERCLGAIEEYESAFSERRFQPEALYLRMEAFAKLGDAAGERATAERLLAAFPRAPQSARAKVVLGQTTP
jgi:hypothetical protein